MQNKNTIRRTVFLYLLLHTTVVVMLVLLLEYTSLSASRPLFLAAVIAVSAALILYTTHTVVQGIQAEIAHRTKALSQISANLQTTLASMGNYAKELERRAVIVDECGKAIKQRASAISEYGERINELLTSTNTSGDEKSPASDGVS